MVPRSSSLGMGSLLLQHSLRNCRLKYIQQRSWSHLGKTNLSQWHNQKHPPTLSFLGEYLCDACTPFRKNILRTLPLHHRYHKRNHPTQSHHRAHQSLFSTDTLQALLCVVLPTLNHKQPYTATYRSDQKPRTPGCPLATNDASTNQMVGAAAATSGKSLNSPSA